MVLKLDTGSSLVIKEMQIKTVRYHNTTTRMADKPSIGKDVDQLELLYMAGGNAK